LGLIMTELDGARRRGFVVILLLSAALWGLLAWGVAHLV
jgi:hypothetical protein